LDGYPLRSVNGHSLRSWYIWYATNALVGKHITVTEFVEQSTVQYPGFFVCLPSEALSANNTAVRVQLPAILDAPHPYETDQIAPEAVCPRQVTFQAPALPGHETGFKAVCVDFQPNPVHAKKHHGLQCPQDLTASTWTGENGARAPGDVWAATTPFSSLQTVLEIEIWQDAFPVFVLMYSDHSEHQPPTTFEEYSRIFSLASAMTQAIPLGADALLTLHKLVTNGHDGRGKCNIDTFTSTKDIYNIHGADGDVADGKAGVSMRITYQELQTERSCPQSIVGFEQVVGVVGGGSALILTLNYFLVVLIVWVENRMGKTPEDHIHEMAGAASGSLGKGMVSEGMVTQGAMTSKAEAGAHQSAAI
jgi:hypothetical protein